MELSTSSIDVNRSVLNRLSQLLNAALNSINERDSDSLSDYVKRAYQIIETDTLCERETEQSSLEHISLPVWQCKKLTQYVHENLHSEIHTEDLAEICNLSEGYFFRAFKSCFNETPQNYVSRMRIERAINLMLSTEYSLAEIANECGFCDQSHFTKVFRKFRSTSPGRWKSIIVNE